MRPAARQGNVAAIRGSQRESEGARQGHGLTGGRVVPGCVPARTRSASPFHRARTRCSREGQCVRGRKKGKQGRRLTGGARSSVRAREGAPVGCIGLQSRVGCFGLAQEKRWAGLVGKLG
jgi:hypothetical protein